MSVSNSLEMMISNVCGKEQLQREWCQQGALMVKQESQLEVKLESFEKNDTASLTSGSQMEEQSEDLNVQEP